jgi:hypothetical protein
MDSGAAEIRRGAQKPSAAVAEEAATYGTYGNLCVW